MIDLHCHILPGIDDGAKTMDESIVMARLAVAEGITHILATPHYKNGRWTNEKDTIIQGVQLVQKELDDREIALTLFPGQEVRIVGELMQDIAENRIQFIDEDNQYLMIEFPTATIPAYTDSLFFNLKKTGVTPIIVHPERNHALLKDPNILLSLIQKGALAQLTAGSYVGTFGKKIQQFSKQLIAANLVHLIASDAHNITTRSFHMKDAYRKLEKEFGKETVMNFKQVTKDLINGEMISPSLPNEIKKSKFLGLF
ncbi:protein-tyrosine phosphatase [Carnobacterium iners]|uniref:Tyrosine-protein phosphatase n=1 Tax=Carnobacterium iners TaxID=1073423 RepID=A0A1X7N8G5_9LACT|nr:CpsB/CapC family capsule biosynthesis tyrosine phosphatase [Carnobacterium iners]SEL20541.1 protein-tyrosine phosphatase [Carnobacterium iners]SMH33843.1 protein-tyrosine phosphatase [Carnobacterium iners]